MRHELARGIRLGPGEQDHPHAAARGRRDPWPSEGSAASAPRAVRERGASAPRSRRSARGRLAPAPGRAPSAARRASAQAPALRSNARPPDAFDQLLRGGSRAWRCLHYPVKSDRSIPSTTCGRRSGAKEGVASRFGHEPWPLVHDEVPGLWKCGFQLERVGSRRSARERLWVGQWPRPAPRPGGAARAPPGASPAQRPANTGTASRTRKVRVEQLARAGPLALQPIGEGFDLSPPRRHRTPSRRASRARPCSTARRPS